MNKEYAQKVEILLRILPIVMGEKVFAVHGGSAINLFIKDLPRYSVDIDLTYTPLESREESINHISNHLQSIAEKAKRSFRGIHIVSNKVPLTGASSNMATSKITLPSNGNK